MVDGHVFSVSCGIATSHGSKTLVQISSWIAWSLQGLTFTCFILVLSQWVVHTEATWNVHEKRKKDYKRRWFETRQSGFAKMAKLIEKSKGIKDMLNHMSFHTSPCAFHYPCLVSWQLQIVSHKKMQVICSMGRTCYVPFLTIVFEFI
jgi:hypothetical protein